VTATTTLPARLRAAAETLAELSAMAGYRWVQHVAWTADSLKREADVLEREVPA
jgi:hypothetical protein